MRLAFKKVSQALRESFVNANRFFTLLKAKMHTGPFIQTFEKPAFL